MRSVEARFENGVLKPTEVLELRPGERVRVLILRASDSARWDMKRARRRGSQVKRGELWWADLGAYRPREQTGRRRALTKSEAAELELATDEALGRADALP